MTGWARLLAVYLGAAAAVALLFTMLAVAPLLEEESREVLRDVHAVFTDGGEPDSGWEVARHRSGVAVTVASPTLPAVTWCAELRLTDLLTDRPRGRAAPGACEPASDRLGPARETLIGLADALQGAATPLPAGATQSADGDVAAAYGPDRYC